MNNKDSFDLNYWQAIDALGNHSAARRNDVFRQLSQADGESCRTSLGKETCFFWCWNLWATGGCHESWRVDNPGNTARECISGRFGHSGSESWRDQKEGGELDSQEEVRRFCGSRRDQEEGGQWCWTLKLAQKRSRAGRWSWAWKLNFFCVSCFPTAELRTLSLWLHSSWDSDCVVL